MTLALDGIENEELRASLKALLEEQEERDELRSSPQLHDIEADDLKLFSVRQVARKYGLTEHTVRRHIHQGKLPAHRLGWKFVVTPDDLRAWFSNLQAA